jgi:uncharacterized protein YggE
MQMPIIRWLPVTAGIVAGLGIAAVHPSTVRADERGPERRTISVTGQGEVTAAPDMATLSIAVETVGPKASAAASDNAQRSTSVVNALKSLIGKEDKISTSRYSLEPRYQQPKPGETTEPRITGYLARNEVQVETHKIDSVGSLIDAANGAGANRISGIQFSLSNRNEQLRAALEKAGAEARAQAESVAKALGVRLKEVASAATATVPVVQPRYFAQGMAAMESRAPTPIEPGTLSVSATLQVTYNIE